MLVSNNPPSLDRGHLMGMPTDQVQYHHLHLWLGLRKGGGWPVGEYRLFYSYNQSKYNITKDAWRHHIMLFYLKKIEKTDVALLRKHVYFTQDNKSMRYKCTVFPIDCPRFAKTYFLRFTSLLILILLGAVLASQLSRRWLGQADANTARCTSEENFVRK